MGQAYSVLKHLTGQWKPDLLTQECRISRHPTPDLKAHSPLAFPELVSTGSSIPSFQALDTEKGRGDVQGPHENASRTCWWLGSLHTGLLYRRNLSSSAKQEASHAEKRKGKSPVGGSSRWPPAVKSSSGLPAAGHRLPDPGEPVSRDHTASLQGLILEPGSNCCERHYLSPCTRREEGLMGELDSMHWW